METKKKKKIEGIIVCLLFLFFLLIQIYLLFTNNLNKENEPTFRQWTVIEKEPWKLDWQTNSPDNRPRINYKHEEVLNLSAGESKIYFSDLEKEIIWGLHEFSFSNDENSIYNSYIGENYSLEQINEIEEEGIRLKFFFSPFSEKDEFNNLKLNVVFTIPSGEAFYFEEKDLILWIPKDWLPEKFALSEIRMKLVTEPSQVLIEQISSEESKLFISYYQDKLEQRALLAEFFVFD